MKHFLPVVIGVGLLALISLLVFFWTPYDPSPVPASVKPIGTSTLSHGGPGPVRQDLSATEKPRPDDTDQNITR